MFSPEQPALGIPLLGTVVVGQPKQPSGRRGGLRRGAGAVTKKPKAPSRSQPRQPKKAAAGQLLSLTATPVQGQPS